jgi:hypothetical protein
VLELMRRLLLIAAASLVLPCIAATAGEAARRDRDHDKLPDRWEKRHHLSTHKKSAKGDPDRDRLRNLREYRLRTNPRKKDTDGDGYSDRAEVRAGTNPRKKKDHPPGKPAPSPTPTPSPSPSPGAPDSGNTGVPAGTALAPYTGPRTISTPGTVVDSKAMGCIRVTAPGVVIRRSKISCAGGYAVYSKDGDYSGTPVLIEDSEIECGNGPGTALGEANITARRVNIHGCENGGDINQNFVVQDSYVHDLYTGGSAHADGFQFASGHYENGQLVTGSLNVTISHNTIFGMGADGSFGNAAIISNRGGDRNVLIENNLLAGGGYTIYCEQGATGINYRVLGNAFSRRFSQKIGFFGAATSCSDETQAGNYVFETGQALSLP